MTWALSPVKQSRIVSPGSDKGSECPSFSQTILYDPLFVLSPPEPFFPQRTSQSQQLKGFFLSLAKQSSTSCPFTSAALFPSVTKSP